MPVLGLGKPAFADPLVIKFSHVVSPDAPKGKAALLFKQLAEKYTDGKVTVEVYPNSSLYKDKEELEALQLGSVHLLAPSISKFGPLGVKEFDVFDLPFLMTDDEHARQMMASPMMDELNKKLEDKGVKPLAYWDNGAHVYTANKPLIMPDDFQGLKMRIQGSKSARRGGAPARRHSADHRLRRALSGAADRRRRRRGQCAVEHLDAEILRRAEISHRVASRPADLFADHQQEVLGFAAGRHPPGPRPRGRGIDAVLRRHRGEGQRHRARSDQGERQDAKSTS